MTDFARLLAALTDASVEFIIIGGFAATAHGSAHVTVDLDVVYRRTDENMACLAAALTPLCRFVNLETVQRDGRDFNTAFADLVHLRTALWFHAVEPINRFLTRDESQRQAAKALGLPI